MDAQTRRMIGSIRRADALRGVLLHLFVYLAVLVALYVAQLDWYYFWPLLGWLLGVLVHALIAVGPGRRVGSRADERIAEEALKVVGRPGT